MSWIKRTLMRIGKCPYCSLHYTSSAALHSHLAWAHASQRREWLTVLSRSRR